MKRSERWIAYFSKKVSDADRKELAEMEPMIKEALEQNVRGLLSLLGASTPPGFHQVGV